MKMILSGGVLKRICSITYLISKPSNHHQSASTGSQGGTHRTTGLALFCLVVLVLGFRASAAAQSAPNIVNPLNSTGIMPYAPYDGAEANISLVFGNVNVQLPLLTLPQRSGRTFTLGIVYDSKVYSLVPFFIETVGQWNVQWNQDLFQPRALQYWRYSFPTLQATYEVAGSVAAGITGSQGVSCLTAFVYTDQSGAKHSFTNRVACANGRQFSIFVSDAGDGSFLRLDTSTTGDFVVKEKDGTTIHFKNGWSTTSANPGDMMFDTIVDTNGNVITANKGSNCTFAYCITDTVGRIITIGAGFIQYTDVNGTLQKITFNGGSVIPGPTLTLASSFFSSTNGPVNGPGAASGTAGNFTDSVTIPNGGTGLTFTFIYDSLGELIKIQYPSGGYTRYDYSLYNVQWSNGDGSLGSGRIDFREVTAKHECRSARGDCTTSTEDTTTYTPTLGTYANFAMDVVDPLQNKTHYDFSPTYPAGGTGREIKRQIYSPGGSLLRTITTSYTENPPQDYSLPTEVDVTLETGQSTKKTISYFPITLSSCFSGGAINPCPSFIDNPNATKEYGFDGSLLRTTTRQYASGPNPSLGDVNADHILDRLTDNVVTDGSSTFETQYEYDNYTEGLSPSGATQHQSAGLRGNVTATKRILNGSPLTARYQYDDAGNVVKVTDPLLNSTTFSYADNFAQSSCAPARRTGAAAAYATTITNPLNQTTTSTWNSCNGSVATLTDANKNQTTYSYDALGRQTKTLYADKGSTSYAYNDAPPRTITKTVGASPDPSIVSTTVLDGLARATQVQLNSDPAGVDYTDTGYDALGRILTVSNPYRTTQDSTYGVTTYQYDALGRITQLAPPDGTVPTPGTTCQANNVCTQYSGNATTVTDQAGIQRKSLSDALGRLIEVDEPGAAFSGYAAGATFTIASVNSDGSLQSKHLNPPPGTPGTGSVTIGGPGWQGCDPSGSPCDAGTIWITINGTDQESFPYGTQGAYFGCPASYNTTALYQPPSFLAPIIANCISANSPLVNASANGSTINLTARNTGSNTNYSLSAGVTYDPTSVTQPSFTLTPSGPSLTGGTDSPLIGQLVVDGGTITVSVGSLASVSVNFGVPTPNQTSSAVAAAIASGLNGQQTAFKATATGTNISIQWNSNGSGPNGTAITSSVTWDTTDFSSPSFSACPGMGSSCTVTSIQGGQDPYPSGLAHPYVTQYSYDALGNLTCAVQKSMDTSTFTTCAAAPSTWRSRSFTYDSLSRLLTAMNPESGTISYSYDADGNVLQKISPASNQTGSGNTTISYCYDPLNRLAAKQYTNSPTTPPQCATKPPYLPNAAVTYSYDSGTNGVGHLTSLTDLAGSHGYSYDSMGRILSESRTINPGSPLSPVTKQMRYSYNLAGALDTITYPSTAIVTHAPDGAGNNTSVIDKPHNLNYATSAKYNPDGGVASLISGNSGSFAGVTNSIQYNSRLQVCRITALTSGSLPTSCTDNTHSGNVLDLGFSVGLGVNNNGNVLGVTNYKDTSRSQTFNYDLLNRLISAQNAGTDCSQGALNGKTKFWGNTYNYDAWGNLLQKSVTKCSSESLSVVALTNNQLSGFGYDAAGNMLSDSAGDVGTYDQENRVLTFSKSGVTTTYTYDADGNRVMKTSGNTGTLYWHMSPGVVAESDLKGNLTSEYVFLNGERVARRDSPTSANPTVVYYFSDHLKTTDIVTDATGHILNESDYYPWGGELQFANADSNHYKFAGKERDSETQLDYFGARYYSNALGRFVSADWSPRPDPIPYANLGDPQSLNLYSYVRNLPTTSSDEDGHWAMELGSHEWIMLMYILPKPKPKPKPKPTPTPAPNPPSPPEEPLIPQPPFPNSEVPCEVNCTEDYMKAWLKYMHDLSSTADPLRTMERILNHLPNQQIDTVKVPAITVDPKKLAALIRLLTIIDSTGQPPAGTKGGTTFANDGRGGGQMLPPTDGSGSAVSYKEWDVNPLPAKGARDAERLVTGSDGSAYYTSDHYKTFQKVK